MQFTVASIVALFAASSLAAPAGNYAINNAQVALSNDMTGANSNAQVPIDGVSRRLVDLYAGTNIAKNGPILISSVMLTGGLAFNPTCTFFTPTGAPVNTATLTSTKTFAKLGNDPNMLQVVDWTSFTITCA